MTPRALRVTTAWCAIALAIALAVAPAAAAADRIRPAPSGDPARVAADALSSAKSSCGGVTKAKRLRDGVVEAFCSSGARFLVFTMKGATMTKRCTATRTLGVHGC